MNVPFFGVGSLPFHLEMRPLPSIPRGVVLCNWRDWEDTFTDRPTRTDFERGRMLDIAKRLELEVDR